LFAPLFSYVDPNQSEFQLSAMVLAMIVIGGAGSLPGAVLGALIVAGYDRVIIPNLGAWLAAMSVASGWPLLAALDLRNLNYFWFGLALYVTVRLRERAG
jgi:ABC-type branched-subunit amino acid transport system permease subunit